MMACREQPETTHLVFADFDGVTYRLSTAAESKTLILLSMSIKCFPELKAYGAEQILAREYAGFYQSSPEPGFDVTLRIDVEQVAASPDPSTHYCISI